MTAFTAHVTLRRGTREIRIVTMFLLDGIARANASSAAPVNMTLLIKRPN